MGNKVARLFFIDAMRAWAILMMLQGHFVDGLLDNAFRDPENGIYTVWKYFRGITAPVFFTVSGFIFTYLLIRVPGKGFDNPRIIKGVRRGLQLLFIGYLLRLNFFGLFKGQIYGSFYLVDVLHIIGLSILSIIAVYLLTQNRAKYVFPTTLILITLILFALEPVYKEWTFAFMPEAVANYFTKANGSVFTIIPWLGYTAFGAFASVLFTKFREFKYIYPVSIGICAIAGLSLIYFSSPLFLSLSALSGIGLFEAIYNNNYLFIRLGDVLVVFAVFMTMRYWLTGKMILKIGQNTLSIYVIHFIVLYGSLTGLGLYRFFHHSLSPAVVIPGAILFMILCSYTALWYDKHEHEVKLRVSNSVTQATKTLEPHLTAATRNLKAITFRLIRNILSWVRA